ncbi:MAG: EexN family lipoprotein [Novosphingobium sp.]
MNIPRTMIAALAVITLSACNKAEPRSSQYFAAHLDEARQIITQCRDGAVRGDECTNADMAVQEADSKARFRKFLGH